MFLQVADHIQAKAVRAVRRAEAAHIRCELGNEVVVVMEADNMAVVVVVVAVVEVVTLFGWRAAAAHILRGLDKVVMV